MRSCLFIVIQFCASVLYAAPDKTVNPASPPVTDPVGVGDFVQVFFGLAIIVIAIFAMAWIIKRTGYVNTRANGQLKIIGGLSLTQRERLLLVQVGEKQILIGVTPGRISTLHELEQSIDLSADEKPQTDSFAHKLQSLLRGEKP